MATSQLYLSGVTEASEVVEVDGGEIERFCSTREGGNRFGTNT